MSGSSVVHEQDCPARYGCCPADEYGCVLHVEPACNCGADRAGSVSVEAASVASDGPPFDPRMDLRDVPDDWRVLWCPGCGYAVTWDEAFEATDDDPAHVVWQEAAPHDCPRGERDA